MHTYTTTIRRAKTWYRGTCKAYVVSMLSGRYSKSGKHNYRISTPLGLFLRDVMKRLPTMFAIKKELKLKAIKVNGKPISTHRYPLAALDSVELDRVSYRVLLGKRVHYEPSNGRCYARVWKSTRLCRRPSQESSCTYQVNCLDGRNFLESQRVRPGKIACYSALEPAKKPSYVLPQTLAEYCVIKGAYKRARRDDG